MVFFVASSALAVSDGRVAACSADAGWVRAQASLTARCFAHPFVQPPAQAALPLQRLWCLYEIAQTHEMRHQLQLLTHDFELQVLRAVFRGINAETADCWSQKDKARGQAADTPSGHTRRTPRPPGCNVPRTRARLCADGATNDSSRALLF